MSTHARPLAVQLAAASDPQLAALFAARGVREDAPWRDFFDAAEALLDPASIARMLPQLTLAEATTLRRAVDRPAARDEAAPLVELALLRADGTPPPPVADAIDAREVPPQAPDRTTPDASGPDAAAHAAERAFTSVAALADVLMLTRESPLALLTAGNLGASEKRRLGDAGLAVSILDDLVAIAEVAGLATATDRRLRVTAAGESWLRLSAAERWALLAEAFRAALPRGLRHGDGGWVPFPHWALQHPWDASWPQRSRELAERARLLGLIADDGTEPSWARSLRAGSAADSSALQRMLPTEVDRIFLQNDLSAIAPGPLAPALDVRLRGIAVRESAAQASSYRFTAASVSHALASGETATGILDFLGGLSLTGIPQPLEYLVVQTAQRHGLVRVSANPEGARTRIESADATLLDAMAVDQSLRPLGLLREADGLISNVGRDSVYWSLIDARYPATLVDADGRAETVDRNPAPSVAPVPAPTYTDLIARLRAQEGPDADAAWLDRELDAAVRAKAVLAIEIGMPDGSVRALLLEASGLGGGRLRGRDRAADVERTLPVRSILSARIVDASPDA